MFWLENHNMPSIIIVHEFSFVSNYLAVLFPPNMYLLVFSLKVNLSTSAVHASLSSAVILHFHTAPMLVFKLPNKLIIFFLFPFHLPPLHQEHLSVDTIFSATIPYDYFSSYLFIPHFTCPSNIFNLPPHPYFRCLIMPDFILFKSRSPLHIMQYSY